MSAERYRVALRRREHAELRRRVGLASEDLRRLAERMDASPGLVEASALQSVIADLVIAAGHAATCRALDQLLRELVDGGGP